MTEGIDEPWPLDDAIAKLVEATEILLDTYDYDGVGYEAIMIARDVVKKHLADTIRQLEKRAIKCDVNKRLI